MWFKCYLCTINVHLRRVVTLISISVDDIRTRFPEFSSDTTYPDNMIQFSIDDAIDGINGYGKMGESKQTRGAYYLSAHYLVMAYKASEGDTDSISPIASKSLGDASISYQGAEATSDLTATYNATLYGQKFLLLVRTWRLQNQAVGISGG